MKLINSKRASLIAGPDFMLVPGINQLSDETWQRAKETFAIQAFLKTGELTDETPAPAVPSEQAESRESEETSSALSSLNVDQARGMIRKTFDLDLLSLWESQDQRASVLREITSQKAKIEAATKKPKEGEQPPADPNLEG